MKHAIILFGLAVALIVSWGVAFSVVEHVATLTGMYWALTTAATVGYGDVTPSTTAGHLLAMGTMLTAIPMLATCFTLVTSWHIRGHMRRHVDERMNEQSERHDLAISGIRNILLKLEDHDGPGRP